MKDSLAHLRSAVERIYQHLNTAAQRSKPLIARVHPQQKHSATNLIHYLALRREDLRPMQDDLHDAGLSSLASSESHILRQVQAVLQRLGVVFPPCLVLSPSRHAHRLCPIIYLCRQETHSTSCTPAICNSDIPPCTSPLPPSGVGNICFARTNINTSSPIRWIVRTIVHRCRRATKDGAHPSKSCADWKLAATLKEHFSSFVAFYLSTNLN